MNFIGTVRKKLHELRDSNRIAQAKIKAHKARLRQRDDALLARMGIRLDKRRTMHPATLWLHAIITFALFAGTIYLLIMNYVGKEQKPFGGAILLPFLLPIIYLLTVHFLSKKRK
jgi:hypothetical protein